MILDKQWRTLRADDKRQEKVARDEWTRKVAAHDDWRVEYYLKSQREFKEACADGSAHDKETYDYLFAGAVAGIRILREVMVAEKRRQAKRQIKQLHKELLAQVRTQRYERLTAAAA